MKFGIIGFSKLTRDSIPWHDDSWELWGVNHTYTMAPADRPLDAILELHSSEIYEWPLRRPPTHLAYLQQFAGPVYLIEARPDIPTSVTYPLAEVVETIGRPYLTSSVAYAIALAIHQGAATIGLWGIDLVTTHEYTQQRPCVEWLLGLAHASGVEIVLPEGCKLLSGPLYGRGDANTGGERLTHQQFEERLVVLQTRERELTEQIARCHHSLGLVEGSLAESDRVLRTIHDRADLILAARQRRQQLEARQTAVQAEMAGLSDVLVRINGQIEECRFWVYTTPEGGDPERVLPGAGQPSLKVVGELGPMAKRGVR